MLEHEVSEGVPRDLGVAESVDRFVQRRRHARDIPCLIRVPDEHLGGFDLVGYPVQSRGDRRRECEVRVRIRPRDPHLDAEASVLAHRPEPAGSVVSAPDDRRGCP